MLTSLLKFFSLICGWRFSMFIFIIVSSCTQVNSPRPVAEKFLEAFQKQDFNEARKYGTKETVKLLQILERMIQAEDLNKDITRNSITITSEEIAGDKATIYFKEAGENAEQKLMLKKVLIPGEKEKQWRVVLTKEDSLIRGN